MTERVRFNAVKNGDDFDINFIDTPFDNVVFSLDNFKIGEEFEDGSADLIFEYEIKSGEVEDKEAFVALLQKLMLQMIHDSINKTKSDD